MATFRPFTHPSPSESCHPATSHGFTCLQILTVNILLGWTFYVVSLSQAGNRTAFDALGDAVKGVGEASLEKLEGGRGMGLFSAATGGEPDSTRGRTKLISFNIVRNAGRYEQLQHCTSSLSDFWDLYLNHHELPWGRRNHEPGRMDL